MRRQVITAGLLGLVMATTSLPALAGGGDDFNGTVDTEGPGYDVSVDVWNHSHRGSTPHHGDSGHRDKKPHRDDHEATAIDGMSESDAWAVDHGYGSADSYACRMMKSYLDGAGSAALSPAERKSQTDDFTKKCKADPSGKAAPPDPAQVGRHAAMKMVLPGARPVIAPDPSLNRWHSAAVGQALWLSVNDPTATKRESLSFMGQAVSLTARRNGLSFEMGDGHTVHCDATTQWSESVEPGTPSPTCGYTYQQAAPEGGYQVTAITSWDVTWSVLGRTGTVHIEKAGGQMLPVGELESVVTRR